MKHIARGDLFRRIKLNRRRLRAKMYRAPFVFLQDSAWPGDWVGRCILGLASLYHAFEGHDSFQEDVLAQLREIIEENPTADFILMSGKRIMIKRTRFEQYLDRRNWI